MKTVAVLSSKGLGDALLAMIVSHNLFLNGYQVTTFNPVIQEMQDWFPKHKLLKYPVSNEELEGYDRLISFEHCPLNHWEIIQTKGLIVKDEFLNKKWTFVKNLEVFCSQQLKLRHVSSFNGITVPRHLEHRKYSQRVVIHPECSELKKKWDSQKFIKLYSLLKDLGYQPFFCVSEKERKSWLPLIPDAKILPRFSQMNEIAGFIYESGYLIGNDSGLGHLASNLAVPTVSLFAKKSYSRLWRPGWTLGVVVCPCALFLGSKIKQLYWKKWIRPKKVLNAFKKLLKFHLLPKS